MKPGNLISVKLLLTLLAIVAGVWATYHFAANDQGNGKRQGPRQSVIGVELGTVDRRDLALVRVFNGTLIAERQYDAAVKIGGRIRAIGVNLGDCIVNGTLIARLEDDEFQQQFAQAQAELDVAQASLAEAKSSLTAAERDYRRAAELKNQKVASAAELEAAETARLVRQAGVMLAEAKVKQQEAALQTATLRLSYTSLLAQWPAEGSAVCRFVAQRHVNEGDIITANQVVATLVDLSLLTAVVHVAESDYAQLSIGQPAQIKVDAFASASFVGQVARISPVFDVASRQARVEISVANPDNRLKAGMFAQVQIEFDRALQTLTAPVAAIIRRQGTSGVFVVEQDTARFVPITAGIEHQGRIEVTGLEVGQQLVTLGHHLLSDGTRVTTGEASQPSRQVGN